MTALLLLDDAERQRRLRALVLQRRIGETQRYIELLVYVWVYTSPETQRSDSICKALRPMVRFLVPHHDLKARRNAGLFRFRLSSQYSGDQFSRAACEEMPQMHVAARISWHRPSSVAVKVQPVVQDAPPVRLWMPGSPARPRHSSPIVQAPGCPVPRRSPSLRKHR